MSRNNGITNEDKTRTIRACEAVWLTSYMSNQIGKSSKQDPVGSWLAATYLVLVILIYVYTASTTTIYKAGYDWIPFIVLTMPWCRWGWWFIVPGVITNAILLYGVGRVPHTVWHRLRDAVG
jgi:hypothetical protein